MRTFVLAALSLALLAGCESMGNAVQTSRQERCQIADWPKVGERDGFDGMRTLGDKYAYICGELFQRGPYEEGLRKGLARRPTPPA